MPLSACSAVDSFDDKVRPVIEAANDKTLDRSRMVICQNTYRAEMAFINRNNMTAKSFKEFCGRQGGMVR